MAGKLAFSTPSCQRADLATLATHPWAMTPASANMVACILTKKWLRAPWSQLSTKTLGGRTGRPTTPWAEFSLTEACLMPYPAAVLFNQGHTMQSFTPVDNILISGIVLIFERSPPKPLSALSQVICKCWWLITFSSRVSFCSLQLFGIILTTKLAVSSASHKKTTFNIGLEFEAL